jgi:hypothetical protein
MTQATHVDYNQACAVCHARLVLHPMFLKDGGPDFAKKVKCPGFDWIPWDAALGQVALCECCRTTLPPGPPNEFCAACRRGGCAHA